VKLVTKLKCLRKLFDAKMDSVDAVPETTRQAVASTAIKKYVDVYNTEKLLKRRARTN
jgi:hypothetical protein